MPPTKENSSLVSNQMITMQSTKHNDQITNRTDHEKSSPHPTEQPQAHIKNRQHQDYRQKNGQ